MIHVAPQPEPADFEAQVRGPGTRWLAENPRAPADRLPPHWRRLLPELRHAYKGICAYYGCHVQPATGGHSVDHFVPKSGMRALAYEWDNYRFACARMNSRKRDAADVVDPFALEDGWFLLRFSTMRVLVAPGLDTEVARVVRSTIRRLKLNTPECCEERGRYWDYYARGQIRAEYFVKHAPFVAMEVARQGLFRPEDRPAFSPAAIRAWLDA